MCSAFHSTVRACVSKSCSLVSRSSERSSLRFFKRFFLTFNVVLEGASAVGGRGHLAQLLRLVLVALPRVPLGGIRMVSLVIMIDLQLPQLQLPHVPFGMVDAVSHFCVSCSEPRDGGRVLWLKPFSLSHSFCEWPPIDQLCCIALAQRQLGLARS